MKPYIYEIKGFDENSAEEEAGDEIASRKRKGGAIDHVQKQKRVTLNKLDLETCLVRLFKERPNNEGYKIGELEQRLNHPRQTLKAALRSLCNYDF